MGEAGGGEGVACGACLIRTCRSVRCVSGPQPRFEAAFLIEAMDAWIGPAALQEDMVAILSPCFRKRRADHRAAMAASLIPRMRHDVFDDAVLATAAQQIRYRDQHAGRDDCRIRVGHKDKETIARQGLRPNLLGLFWFGVTADLRRLEQSEQGCEVGGLGRSGKGHDGHRFCR